MNADPRLRQLLTAADLRLPLPPALPLTATRLEELLRQRRKRTGFVIAGVLCTLIAIGAMWQRSPPNVTTSARMATIAEVEALRAEIRALVAHLQPQEPESASRLSKFRADFAVERAALAGAMFAEQLDAIDPAAAARQRDCIATLHPDTFAGQSILAATAHPKENR